MALVSGDEAVVVDEYSILNQRVDLDVDFTRCLTGSTEITVQPLVKDLRRVRFHCRQCKPTAVQVGGITAKWEYNDPYRRTRLPGQSNAHQHGMLKERIEASLRPAPEPELTVTLPPKFKVQEVQLDPTSTLPHNESITGLSKEEGDGAGVAETPTVQTAQQKGPQFAPLKIFIDFEVPTFRDGIHWIGDAEGDKRYPCMYTKSQPWPGNSSCIFPCVDDATSRCSWDISIRCPRTLGDAFRTAEPQVRGPEGHGDQPSHVDNVEMVTSESHPSKPHELQTKRNEEYSIDLSDQDAALELSIVCVGEAVDDVPDVEDVSRHTVSFSLSQPVTARHVGFAIGPFEQVDLSQARTLEQEDKLGQSAIKVYGYCLPGKSDDLRNTCWPLAWALDSMSVKYGSFPFSTYQVVFVDDLAYDTVAIAGLSLCSTTLLFPMTIEMLLISNTYPLVRTLAEQWVGVNVIAKEPTDQWVVAGMTGFMTDNYMMSICGNNDLRWRQKLAAEKVYDLDVDRPSLRQLGQLLHLDYSIQDFVNTKSALVLFILDRRLLKTGQTGVQRIINKIFMDAKTGALVNGEVSTADFQRQCERFGHNKLEPFFRQWVFQSGCPIFYITQRFNKKKLVVEVTIAQKQLERITKPAFEPSNFMREIKEHVQEVWAPEVNPVFTGPMTIRIHEAGGIPYEHIVEIKEAVTKLEIPYNTKYKRVKRSRHQSSRQTAGNAAEGGDDARSFGNTLSSDRAKAEWNLVEWTAEDEEKMGQESYEWIRMDADFEWIGKIHLVMPLYMYISQLQQDSDVVAQYESMRYLLGSNPHHVSLSILTQTLVDDRYFWGIRELAAEGLATCAKGNLAEIGQFHLLKAFRSMFCIPGTDMPRSNDFSDLHVLLIQCAIPKAMAKLRDAEGKVPWEVRGLLVSLLKFNDNSNNWLNYDDPAEGRYSDNHYLATLMSCLVDSLIASHRAPQPTYTFSFGEEEPIEPEDNADAELEKLAVDQIERVRRIDQYEASYQNIYSTTALEALQRLTRARIVKGKEQVLMTCTKIGNADNVRLAAWRCASEMGILRKTGAMRYFLHCVGNDPSPRFRAGLLKIFGEALGHVALGEPEPEPAPPQPAADEGLVLEQETSNEARRIEATRKTTPEGALVALKAALVNEAPLARQLWDAATSSSLTLDEVAALCDIAALVYEPIDSLTLSLKLPKMWRCENLGQGKVKFVSHGPYRAAPRKGLSVQDWDNLQKSGLKYSGPLSEEVRNKQQELKVKLKIKPVQQQVEQPQIGPGAAEMPPPPMATPSTEKPTGIKLNLGAKRKQSMDLSAAQRAGSPKSQKVSRQQSPAGSIQTPRSKGSPAANQRRSSTPGSRSSAGKGKDRKPVVLHLGSSAARAKEILSIPPKSTQAEFPLPQPQPQPPPAFSPMNYFTAPSPQTMNIGAFRTYEPVPDADVGTSEMNQGGPEISKPKLTLKLGRKPSNQVEP